MGGYISNDFKWNDQIKGKDGSIFKSVVSRINALKQISSFSDFKTRKMIANGVIMSKFLYLIQLWGGCEGYLLHALQVQLNKAARLVTGQSGFTSTRKLMETCRRLSVKQLVVYQSAIRLDNSN